MRGGYELEQKVAALCRPETYPEPPRRIEVVETHMSFVFLTATHAFKMKKPVRYELLDFSTLELRRHYCEEELRLNQRLAPGVYRAVLPLCRTANDRLQIAGSGEPVEWLVQMRRLPQARMLDERIRTGSLEAREIDAVAERLAAFYRAARPEAVDIEDLCTHFAEEADRDKAAFDAHADVLGAQAVAALHRALLAFLERERALLRRRIEEGRFVEGHGDLRPEHVCLLDEPVIFDCIEFNHRLRIVDPVAELSFLAMECELLGAPEVGERLLDVYASRTGDRAPHALVDYYKASSASLRARLSILHTRELEPASWGRWIERTRRYLALALRYAALPPAQQGHPPPV